MKKIILAIFFFAYLIFIGYVIWKNNQENFKKVVKINHTYINNNCINAPYLSITAEKSFQNLIEEYQEMHLSFYFEDIKNQYSIKLKENQLYYGASILKLLEAIYLINQAMEKNLSLDEMLIYEKKHIRLNSPGMSKYSVGDKISLENLIYYAVFFSDNTAHEMLYSYIGLSTLKEYAKSLGITLTINNSEHYGYLTAEYGNKILKEAFKIISLDNPYSEFLKNAMNNNIYNSLNFENKTFLHKYGLWEPYYNDIGIFMGDSPYYISIFTTYAQDNYTEIIKELSKKIYDIYYKNLKEKEQYCSQYKIKNGLKKSFYSTENGVLSKSLSIKNS